MIRAITNSDRASSWMIATQLGDSVAFEGSKMRPPGHSHQHDHDHDHDGNCLPRSSPGPLLTQYAKHGVRFSFPSDWTMSEESDDQETTISLQSDGTSFWTLMLLKSRPDPDAVLDTVVSAFEQDYEDVDVISTIDNLGGLPALGRDLDFVCYDLVNSASARACQTSLQTVLVLSQGTDHELQVTSAQMKSITDSLQWDDEDLDDEIDDE